MSRVRVSVLIPVNPIPPHPIIMINVLYISWVKPGQIKSTQTSKPNQNLASSGTHSVCLLACLSRLVVSFKSNHFRIEFRDPISTPTSTPMPIPIPMPMPFRLHQPSPITSNPPLLRIITSPSPKQPSPEPPPPHPPTKATTTTHSHSHSQHPHPQHQHHHPPQHPQAHLQDQQPPPS